MFTNWKMKYIDFILLLLLGSVRSAKILGVFTYRTALSHQRICRQITKELSLRGHQVTVVTPNPLKDATLTNLTEIDVHFVYDLFKKSKVQEKFSKANSPVNVMISAYKMMDVVVELELNSTDFRKLLSDRNQNFDLILIHFLHPLVYGLGEKYQAPVVSISPIKALGPHNEAVANPNHPVLFPDFFFVTNHGQLTLWQKFESIYFFLWQLYYHYWIFLPSSHQMAKRYFGDVPYIGDLEKNVSMVLVQRDILIDAPKPNVPGVVDFSFINLEPPKPLPDDLQKFLDEATEGAIYVSFGTLVNITLFSKALRDCILGTLPELPYKILIKWDSDDFPTKSSNILARKWYPQRDLLAHTNVKVVVTQGGSLSIEDAIMGEVPLIGIPFVTDQPKNVRRLVELGIGEEVDLARVNKDEFKNVIIKVAENISYKENIKSVRKILLDKSKTGLENAVWWCEYVLRQKGAKHLKSPCVGLSYVSYFLLDIILIVIFTVWILYCIVLTWKR